MMAGSTEYGKNGIRVMRMRKEGDVTFIKEVSVDVMIKLTNLNENENNENPDVFDSATMKDKVHSLAKQTGVSSTREENNKRESELLIDSNIKSAHDRCLGYRKKHA